MPAAERDITTELVRELLREQAPDLADLPITVFGNGWDNALFRLGDDLLVRIPRRAAAAQLVLNEQRWLPELAPRLPLPVPVPRRVGRPSALHPWAWSIVDHLDGTHAGTAENLDTAAAARTLGAFAAAMHRPAPAEAPENPLRGVDLHLRGEGLERNLALLADAFDTTAAERAWAIGLDARPWAAAPVWLHGDLHPANLLVRDGRVAAVLDFGDLTSGDPATDLAVAWMLLPRADRDTFWQTYAALAGHPVERDLVARSRGWAAVLTVAFLANSADDPVVRAIGLRTAAALAEG